MAFQGSESSSRRLRAAAFGAVVALVAVAVPAVAEAQVGPGKRLPALAPSADDALGRALRSGRLTEPEYALERALSLFRPQDVRARFGRVARPHPHEATLILRDLAARVSQLAPADRALARRILARPTDGPKDPVGNGYSVPSTTSCTTNLCFHWVSSTADAPPPTDANANGVPDWVEVTAATFETVWAKEIGELGFRGPRSDLASPNNGGDGRLDVYLADIGTRGFFGYCTTDDPNANPANGYPFYDVSAYCVVDNDFSPAQYPRVEPLPALQVTAAHEFFHAIQYAYDWLEDLWLMEGTAAWVEDEVYDDVNDNVSYLARGSVLVGPGIPLDFGSRGFEYGAWIFWRYLAERFGQRTIREVWQLVDASGSGRDMYSLQATRAVLRQRGTSLTSVFAGFAVANRFPRLGYDEGESYPRARTHARHSLGTRSPSTGTRRARLRHLTNRYVSFFPGRGVSRTATLRVSVDLPKRATAPVATVAVVSGSRVALVRRIRVDRSGRGSIRVPFGSGRVSRVDLVLTNASARSDCWWDTPFACAGLPRDDRAVFRFRASLGGRGTAARLAGATLG